MRGGDVCIIIFKPVGAVLKKKTLATCFENNKHGAGFVYYDPDNQETPLIVEKGFFSFSAFWRRWRPHSSKKAILHFRIKTNGTVCEDNCHPFIVGNVAFAHNGTIRNVTIPAKTNISDTRAFGDQILSPLLATHGELWKADEFNLLMSLVILGSKIVMMDTKGDHVIFNESLGTWTKSHNGIDCWFSNETYKKTRSEIKKSEKPTENKGMVTQ